MDIEAIYRAIVEGAGDGGDLAWTRRALQHLALQHAKTGNPEVRLGALRVSALLGPIDGLPVANELVTDADPRIRTLAFNQVVAAREGGLPGIRSVAEGRDPDLAVAAFDLLVGWVDAPASALARRCLASAEPRIRVRAATLLGHVAGVAVGPDLRRLAESDPAAEVRAAATEALRRIAGELPGATREPWWSDAPEPAPLVAPPEPNAPVSTALVVPETPTASSDTPTAPPSPEAPAADTPSLLRRLGTARPEEQVAAVDALLRAPATERAACLARWTSGADPALGQGLARAAAAFGEAGALSRLLTMLSDPDPGVRTAAVGAIAAVGSAGSIPRLSALFVDTDPAVAAAAIRAMAALAIRVGRADVGRGQLSRVGGTVPDAVAEAVAEARELLGAG